MVQVYRGTVSRSGLRHEEMTVRLAAGPGAVFGRLDDPARFGEHMSERSMMMLGGRMSYECDGAGGREVGSVIRMSGTILGLRLTVEEMVLERVVPYHKVWETVGRPRLLVIDWYRMGFDIEPDGSGSRLHVFIDYAAPQDLGPRALIARPLARAYARWCVRRIARDAARAFRISPIGEPGS